MSRDVRRGLAVGAVLVALAVGCGGNDDDTADATSAWATSPGTVSIPALDAEPAAADGGALDACTLLSDAEAEEALGGAIVESGPTFGVGESVCAWETEGDWSVTVSVGSPGTAPGNSFEPFHLMGGEPKPVEGLEAAWAVGLGTVDFAAAERHNSVQVVSAAAGGGDAEAAARLASVLAERIESAG